jgi:HlyD family secretion protein
MKISKKIMIGAIILAAAGGGSYEAYSYFGSVSANQPQNGYLIVKKTDLTQTVNAEGQIKAANNISLSFERGGEIAFENVQTGQTVRRGQTLARLDTSDLTIQLGLAQNALDNANIKLNQLTSARDASADESTEIQTAINNGRENAANKIKAAYIAADGIMGTSIDQFFWAPNDNPIFGLKATKENSIYIINAPIDTSSKLNQERRKITVSMDKWEKDSATIDQENIDIAQNDAESTLELIQSLLTDLAAVVNSYNPANAADSAFYGSYKSIVQNARAATDSTLAGIISAKQTYNSSKASANPDDIKIQKIAVSNAENQLKSIQNQIIKSSIYSPIDGIVSAQNAKVGQTASAGIPLIDIISDANLQIDVYLPESDVAKAKIGQIAAVTVDAFGDQQFKAHVVAIDPESQKPGTTQGYKTTLQFDQNNNQLKPGMTANASIETAQKSLVVAIPANSIIKDNGDEFVMVETDNQGNEKRKITTGITGSDNYVEVVDGLKEGETIINY